MFREEPQYTEVNPGANAELRCVIENIGGECRWQKDGKVSFQFMFSKKTTKNGGMVDLTLVKSNPGMSQSLKIWGGQVVMGGDNVPPWSR